MAEPPVRVSPEGVEAEVRKLGHRWLDLIIAGSAIVISLVSLGIGLNNSAIMQKQVAAASWPLLQYQTGNIDEATGKPTINLAVQNVGVGPALVKDFRVFWNGKAYAEPHQLLRACCGLTREVQQNVQVITASVGGTVIGRDESRTYLRLDRTPQTEALWARLNDERFRLKFDACYCSVFDECWRSDLTGIEPRKVKRCNSGGR